MILFNFAHPLTERQKQTVEQITNETVERIVSIQVQFDNNTEFTLQASELMASIKETTKEWLTTEIWQSASIVVNLPSFNTIASLILAEFHGRMGYFPRVVRMRPVPNSTPPEFEVAEVLNLQAVRDEARKERK